jgi:hypothetical protein
MKSIRHADSGLLDSPDRVGKFIKNTLTVDHGIRSWTVAAFFHPSLSRISLFQMALGMYMGFLLGVRGGDYGSLLSPQAQMSTFLRKHEPR